MSSKSKNIFSDSLSLDKQAISTRLKGFLKDKFGDYEVAAKEMGKTAASLHNGPFKGKTLPSAEIIAHFVKFGGDINWLLWGENKVGAIAEVKITYQSVQNKIESEKIINKISTLLGELKELNETKL